MSIFDCLSLTKLVKLRISKMRNKKDVCKTTLKKDYENAFFKKKL